MANHGIVNHKGIENLGLAISDLIGAVGANEQSRAAKSGTRTGSLD